jgi:peptidoglycan/LPS O-acetylase OafA/YrhL
MKHRILPLDGLRGMAILAVFAYHYGNGGSKLASAGWMGVDLFFVLSGYLITGILFKSQDSPTYYRRFYWHRVLRIFPAYFLFLGVCVAVLPWSTWKPVHMSFLVFAGYPAALIWPSLVQIPIHFQHLWSLSIEEQFYLFWPSVIRKLATKRNVQILCVCLFFIALEFRICLYGVGDWYYGFLPCRMDCLAVGAFLAVWKPSHGQSWAILATSGAVLAAIGLQAHSFGHSGLGMETYGFSFVALFYGALLVLALGPLAWVFKNPILRFFGKYSYGLYLYHFPLTTLTERFKPVFAHLPASSLLYVGACLAANVALAMVSFHMMEKPIMDFGHKESHDLPAGRKIQAAPVAA